MEEELGGLLSDQLPPYQWSQFPSRALASGTPGSGPYSTLSTQSSSLPQSLEYSTATCAGLSGLDGWHGVDGGAFDTLPASGAALSALDSPSWHSLSWEPVTGGLSVFGIPPVTNLPDLPQDNVLAHILSAPTPLNQPTKASSYSSSHSSPQRVPSPGSVSSGSGPWSSEYHSQGRTPEASSDALLKRQRNTIAARKYRQKKIDRIEELEKALEEALHERDNLKWRLVKQEAETEALKRLLPSRKEKIPKR